jgi:hypothetical protein
MYLSTVLFLNINIPPSCSSVQQKQTALTQTYVLTYILLFLSTILVAKARIGGFYFVTLWNMGVLFAIVVGAFAEGAGAGISDAEEMEDDDDRNAALQADSPDAREEPESQPTETTPLIAHRHIANDDTGEVCSTSNECTSGWWCWIVQLLLVVPIPVILVSHIAVFIMGALSQTLADGSSPIIGESFYALSIVPRI